MSRSEIVQQPIQYEQLVESVRSDSTGAIVLFLGTVRELSEGKAVTGLEYEAFVPMAKQKLEEIIQSAMQQWTLNDVRVEHRIGSLDLGDIAVAVVTASAHRKEAFEAAQWIMDTVKQEVPIWKKDLWKDHDPKWQHPGMSDHSDKSLT